MSEVKDYLNRARSLRQQIDAAQEQIIRLQSMATRTTGTYQALRVSGTTERSKLENAAVDLADLGDAVADKIVEFRAAYKEIAAVIDGVSEPNSRQLLTLRYLCFMTWEEVAEKMNLSDRWVRGRLHGTALQKVVVPCSSGSMSDTV